MNQRQLQAMRFGIWLAAGLAMALGMGWVSLRVQAFFAPVLILPALEGMLLGLALAVLAMALELRHRSACLVGGAAAALILVFSQHYFAFWQQRQAIQRAMPPGAAALFQALPEVAPGTVSLPAYLQEEAKQGRNLGKARLHGAAVWLLWSVEAALALAGTVWVLHKAVPKPKGQASSKGAVA